MRNERNWMTYWVCSAAHRTYAGGKGLASALSQRKAVEDHVGRTPLGPGPVPRQGADPQGAPEGGAGGEQKVERAAEGGEDTLPANAEETPWPPAGWHQEPLTKKQ